MAKNTENQVFHLKTSSKYYCHPGYTGGPHTSACQNELPKETERERVKMIKKMDFAEKVKSGDTANLCPKCMEILNPTPTPATENKFIPRTATYSLKRVSGSVTRKADGKLSYSINNSRYLSYAEKFQFKKLGEEIVASNFNHPAVYSVTADNLGGLIHKLRDVTTDLKEIYIEKTKKWANDYYPYAVELSKLSYLDWEDRYNLTDEKLTRHNIKKFSSEYYKAQKALDREKNKVHNIIKNGLEKYVCECVKSAEYHYEDSLVKLSYRLNQKGVKDDTNFVIKSGRIGLNFEITIEHDGLITKAWTIIASGLVQAPHYRYLVK